MAFEFFDYDPLTGLAEYLDFSSDGRTFAIRYEQDVEEQIRYAKFLANTGGTEEGFKGEWWLYGIVPPVMQADLFRRGINFMDPNDTKRVVYELNTNWTHFKTTHRHHE